MSLINNKKAGAYVRLSKEDTDLVSSLENQAELITDYCNNHNLSLIHIYSDFGYTGKNFNRPQFQKMIQDLNAGIINCVVVKDISRFGRTLLGVGKYIDEIFVKQNIRFISITDSFDNADYQENDSIVIRRFLNDYFVKECRKKSKIAIQNKSSKMNLSAGGFYGYLKDEEGRLVIDPITAPVVQRIFELYKELQSSSMVAEVMNKEKVITPLAYRKTRGLIPNTTLTPSNYIWKRSTILNIVENLEYTGTAINLKSICDSRIKKKNESPITLENEHPAIISKELYDEVYAIRHSKYGNKRETLNSTRPEHLSKFLYCPVCGHTYVMQGASNYYRYYYDIYCKTKIKVTSIHYILYQRSLMQINKAKFNPDEFVNTIKNVKLDGKQYNRMLEEIELEENDNNSRTQQLFEEYALGNITKEDYAARMEILKDNGKYLERKKNDLVTYKYKETEATQKATEFMNNLFNLNIKKLSKVIVIKTVIDKVILTSSNDEIIINEINYKL